MLAKIKAMLKPEPDPLSGKQIELEKRIANRSQSFVFELARYAEAVNLTDLEYEIVIARYSLKNQGERLVPFREVATIFGIRTGAALRHYETAIAKLPADLVKRLQWFEDRL